MVYFIVSTNISAASDIKSYKSYIEQVKPIVEGFGGRYLVRSEKITALSPNWSPDRIIIIEFNSRRELDECFNSEAYRKISGLREQSVEANAVIVE